MSLYDGLVFLISSYQILISLKKYIIIFIDYNSTMDSNSEITFKTIVIGAPHAGKTALLRKYMKN